MQSTNKYAARIDRNLLKRKHLLAVGTRVDICSTTYVLAQVGKYQVYDGTPEPEELDICLSDYSRTSTPNNRKTRQSTH